MLSDIFARNNVRVDAGGDRAPLVLAHGLGTNQHIFREIVPRLADRHRIVCFDYVGCGQSDRSAYEPERYSTLSGYADDLVDVVRAVELSTPPVVVGHSISGAISLLASLRAPGLFKGIVLVASSPRYLDDPPHYSGGFGRADVEGFLKLMDENFLGWAKAFAGLAAPQAEVAGELSELLASADPRAIRTFARITLECDVRDVLALVETPCHVVQCREDAVAPVHVGEYLSEHLPVASLSVIDAPGHLPMLSHPDLVAERVGAFAASLA